MKLATPLKILEKFLNAFNHKKKHVQKITDNYERHNYWDQECLEHPTNHSCLIYCD